MKEIRNLGGNEVKMEILRMYEFDRQVSPLIQNCTHRFRVAALENMHTKKLKAKPWASLTFKGCESLES